MRSLTPPLRLLILAMLPGTFVPVSCGGGSPNNGTSVETGGGAGDNNGADGGHGNMSGGSGGGGGAVTADGMAVTTLCEDLRAIADSHYCPEDTDSCEWTNTLGVAMGRCLATARAVDDGRMLFDSELAAACLASASSEDLAMWYWQGNLPAGCSSPFSGTFEMGADCYSDYGLSASECVVEGYCTINACPGVCAPYSGEDGACGDPRHGHPRCESDLVCAFNERFGIDCAAADCEGQCEQPPGEGGDCQRTSGRCELGLSCNYATTPPSCVRLAEGDEPCAAHTDCVSRLCLDETCVDEDDICESPEACDTGEYCGTVNGSYRRTCLPTQAAGEACEPGAGSCAAGLDCLPKFIGQDEDPVHECHERAGIDFEPCLPWGCREDHYCAVVEGDDVCKPRGQSGAQCDDRSFVLFWTNPPCAEELHCMTNHGICLPAGALGEPCAPDNQASCVEGLTCPYVWGAETECQLPSSLGESCNPYYFRHACDESYCECIPESDPECIHSCIPLLADGEDCYSDQSCQSGYCRSTADGQACGQPPMTEEPPPTEACLPPL